VLTSSLKSLVPNSRPEVELLLPSLRPYLDPSAVEHIQAALNEPLDWDYLLQMVEKHRVLPLFYRNLNSIISDQIPAEISKELRKRFFENVKRNLLLTNELLRLLQLFQATGIRVIPYKGTVLAVSVYGKQALRQVWDLDVLVTEADVPKSRSLLLDEGYHLKETNDREQSFFHDTRNVEVDLHWGLTPIYFPIQFDFERLWGNRKSFVLAETSIVSFSTEDLLLILCIQVAKDAWERRQHLEHLAKVCDIAALLQANPELNWAAVMQQAMDTGISRIVSFGLYLAQNLLGANLPQTVRSAVERDRTAILLAQQVCSQLFGTIDESFASSKTSYLDVGLRMNQLMFYLRMRERWDDKIQHIREILRTFIRILTPS
jgi:hypothetical protein